MPPISTSSPFDEYRKKLERRMRLEMRSQLLNSGGQLHDLVCEALCREKNSQAGTPSCFHSAGIGEWKPCDACNGQAKAVIAIVRSTLLDR